METYKIIIQPGALQDLEAIFRSNPGRWSFAETYAYVEEIRGRFDALSQIPHRFSFDPHTRRPKTFRSFAYKAHKVFFTIDEATKTVNIVAVLPSRTKYSAKL